MLLLAPYASSQQAPEQIDLYLYPEDDGLNFRKLSALAATSVVFTSTLVHGYINWWEGNYQPFGFYDPVERGGWFEEPAILGMDKIGHLYGSYLAYTVQKAILEWGGYSPGTARTLSASFAFGIGMLIELGDGFSDYSFDWRDLLMDAAGIFFGVAREEYPSLAHFNLKWSYVPDSWSMRVTKHYPSNIFWLTADVGAMVRHDDGGPSLIQPAIGFSLTDDAMHREFVFGIDFNLNSLLKSGNRELEVIRKTIDVLHIPAPGIKISGAYAPEYRAFVVD